MQRQFKQAFNELKLFEFKFKTETFKLCFMLFQTTFQSLSNQIDQGLGKYREAFKNQQKWNKLLMQITELDVPLNIIEFRFWTEQVVELLIQNIGSKYLYQANDGFIEIGEVKLRINITDIFPDKDIFQITFHVKDSVLDTSICFYTGENLTESISNKDINQEVIYVDINLENDEKVLKGYYELMLTLKELKVNSYLSLRNNPTRVTEI